MRRRPRPQERVVRPRLTYPGQNGADGQDCAKTATDYDCAGVSKHVLELREFVLVELLSAAGRSNEQSQNGGFISRIGEGWVL